MALLKQGQSLIETSAEEAQKLAQQPMSPLGSQKEGATPDQSKMYVYKITNNITKKQYIGQTTLTIEKRWKEHVKKARVGKRKTPLYNSMNKHGIKAFTIECVEVVYNQEELNLSEIKYIEKYNTLVPNGYNLASGGLGGTHHETTKLLLRKKLTGRKFSEESINKMKKAAKYRLDKYKDKYDKGNRNRAYSIIAVNETESIYYRSVRVATEINPNYKTQGIYKCINKRITDYEGYKWFRFEDFING